MRIKYDPEVDAIYIEFAKGKYDRSRKISEAVLVDESKNGEVLGVEILDVKKTIPTFSPEKSDFRIQVA